MDGKDENKHVHDTGHMHVHGHGHGHSSSHMDPSAAILFTMKDLKPGKTLPIYFPRKGVPPLMQSKEEADSIPFSSAHLQNLLDFFSFSPGSPKAKAVEFTLGACELKHRKGETKFCATSKESMIDFVSYMFRQDSQYFRAYSTSYLTKSTTLLQNYTILEVSKEIAAPNMVGCHIMPYPYAIYYCHAHGRENKVFEVSLQGENGDRVDAVSVCHLDTSDWEHDNVSFRMLGIEHGDPVCHFFPIGDLIWVPTPRPTLD